MTIEKVNGAALKNAVNTLKREVVEKGAVHASTRIVLNNGHVMFVSVDKKNTDVIQFYGVNQDEVPEALVPYMKNTKDYRTPYYTIGLTDLIVALDGEIKSIAINSWKY